MKQQYNFEPLIITDEIREKFLAIKTEYKEVLSTNQFPKGFESIRENNPMCFQTLKAERKLVHIDHKTRLYTRYAYAVQNNERILYSDEYVLHLCGNGLCINPTHLKKGTALENMAHKKLHNQQHGPDCRLTKEQVKELRTWYNSTEVTQKEIAAFYKMDHRTISYILDNKHYQDPTYSRTRFRNKSSTSRGNMTEQQIKRICGFLNMKQLKQKEIAKLCDTTVEIIAKIDQGFNYTNISKKYLDPQRKVF